VTTVTLSEGGACLKFSVRDYGEGLSPQASSRLFQKFTQLERSDGRTHMGGLGLGLFGVSVKAQVLGTLLCWLAPCSSLQGLLLQHSYCAGPSTLAL
jgi:Histidine kinase-, DNA gyrase B-, and HSP90-like ATPase